MNATEEGDPCRGAEFLEELARALHVYGLPSHRLEEALARMSRCLGLDAQYLITPTSVLSSVAGEVRLVRIDSGETHLERLTDLYEIMLDVRSGRRTPAEGAEAIRALSQRAPRYGPTTTVLAFALASGSAALFFGGGWRESVGGSVIGGLIGALTLFSSRSTRLGRLLPALSGLLAATVAHGMSVYFPPMFAFLAMLAGLIILIPGLTLTIAMSELAHHHLVSGTSRLTGAAVTFLQLGFGAAIGWKLGPLIGEAGEMGEPAGVAQWLQWAVLPAAAASFVVLFRARPRDYGSILVSATVAFAASRWGSAALGPEVGIAFGAWSVGCTSTLLSRLQHHPAAVALLPGLLLLVPGTLGIRSLQALTSRDVPLGVESAFTMTLLAMALVTGLFLANLTFRPRAL